MDTNRQREILDAVRKIADHEEEHVGVRHVCLACGIRTNAIGATVYLVGDAGTTHPLEATGPVSGEIAELQVTLGEGPVSEALRHNHPVLAPHLADSAARWPVFAPAAVAAGVAAMFVFPLTLGAISLGALEICRDTGSPLTPDELADVLLFADTAMTLLLDRSTAGFPTEPERHWAVVHQATGMVSVQLDSDLGDAFLRLRAHSYLTGRRLSEVAADVVARTLRFAPEATNEEQR